MPLPRIGASILDHSAVMQLTRFFLYAFGGVFLLSLIALGRQLGNAHLSTVSLRATLRGSIEGWLLFGVSLVVAVRYLCSLVGADGMPAISSGWLIAYGIGCTTYLTGKAIRAVRTPE